LIVEGAKCSFHREANSNDSFFNAMAKQRDPKPLRIDNAGRRAAEGLFGCVAQYESISSNAIRPGSAR
jgi:hypothetical protein